jgi:4-aminobutyrate aminotransferase
MIEETVLRRIAPPDEVAAIFVEPIQGEGGYYMPPAGFLPALRALCDKHGFLLVADEVQTGMGRTGKLYAVEHWDVEPDIICLAKGIASGMPLGAIIAREEVMDWPSGSHASTFGGNPVSCRGALATLDLLEGGYIANAAERGEQLKGELKRLRQRHPEIREVRGLGLMVAMDLANEDDGSPAAALRDDVIQAAFRHGLLLLGCGECAVRFCPPLCISAEQVETAIRIVDSVLSERRTAALAV